MARELGRTHFHQRENPVEMSWCVQTFQLQSRKRDCMKQMPNTNLVKKKKKKVFFKKKKKRNYRADNKITLFIFAFFFSFKFLQLLQSIPVGVGQVYGCDNPWTGGIFLIALFISSPLICLHAAIGSAVGMLAGTDLTFVTYLYKSKENKRGTTMSGTFTVTNVSPIGEWLLEKKKWCIYFCFKNSFDWLPYSLTSFYDGGNLQKK